MNGNFIVAFRHCHIVNFLGYTADGVVPVLVTEYMEHGALVDFLRSNRSNEVDLLIRM